MLPLKERLLPRGRFGLGLRLANRASHELLDGDALAAFREFLEGHDLYALTVNGFPYGDFHAGAVKQAVYEPDWTRDERAEYSFRLAEILAGLLPEEGRGSISTCPLAYAAREYNTAARERLMDECAKRLDSLARRLRRLHESTGRFITIDLEPEPDGLMEDSDGAAAFFERLTSDAAREHIGLCFDTCHFAVVGEDPEKAFDALRKANISIGKIQLSSAPAVRVGSPESRADGRDDGRSDDHIEPSTAAEALAPFAESVYLHQTVGRGEDGRVLRFRDLAEALPAIGREANMEWRTHFHVPVFLKEHGVLTSTRDEMSAALRIARETKATRVLEIETYTWDVLPPELKGDLTMSLAREYEFILRALGSPEAKET